MVHDCGVLVDHRGTLCCVVLCRARSACRKRQEEGSIGSTPVRYHLPLPKVQEMQPHHRHCLDLGAIITAMMDRHPHFTQFTHLRHLTESNSHTSISIHPIHLAHHTRMGSQWLATLASCTPSSLSESQPARCQALRNFNVLHS